MSNYCLFVRDDLSFWSGTWGVNLRLELNKDCLSPRAQFNFGKNGVVYGGKLRGCFESVRKPGEKHDWLSLDRHNDKSNNCKRKMSFGQTSGGSLQCYYSKPKDKRDYCQTPQSSPGGDYEGKLIHETLACDQENQRFTFGKC